jgi:hypothetical protein
MLRRSAPHILVACLWTGRAAADPLRLTWVAPEGCSSQADIERQIARSLGNPSSHHAALAVRVELRRLAKRRVSVSLVAEGRGESGQRQLEAESCDAAATAAALIVALMVDPALGASAQPAPEPPAPPPPPPPPEPPPLPPAEPETPPLLAMMPRRSVIPEETPPAPAHPPSTSDLAPLDHLSARIAAIGDIGSLPGADVGGELALLLSVRRLRFELAGALFASSNATASALPTEGAHLSLLTVAARGGYTFPLGPLALTPWVGVEVDSETGSGYGGDAHESQTGTWLAVAAGGSLSWRFWRLFSLSLGAEALVPTSRPTFLATDGASSNVVLSKVSALSGRGFLGVECRFH